jgi:membrane protein required for colicin V production
LSRGFTREVLTVVSWGLAALAAFIAIRQEPLILWTMDNVPYASQPILAKVAVGAAAFLAVLIVASIVSVRISDFVVDSATGAIDRTLGFLFGLARGFLLVVIAFAFYGWLVPPEKQEAWVRDARSLPVIQSTGEALCRMLPAENCETLLNTAFLRGAGKSAAPDIKAVPESGYRSNETQGLDNLIQGTGGAAPQPTFGQETPQ